MTCRTALLCCTGFCLLAILGVGVYAYLNLPSLVAGQARASLADYGVRDLSLDNLDVSFEKLSASKIGAKGELDGLSFEISIIALNVSYQWQELLAGRLRSLNIGSVEIALHRNRAAGGAATNRFTFSDYWPQSLIASLPLDSMHVPEWHLSYKALDSAPIHVAGSAHIAEELTVQWGAEVLDATLIGEAHSLGDNQIAIALSLDSAGGAVGQFDTTLLRTEQQGWEWQVQGILHHAPLLRWLEEPAVMSALALPEDSLAAVALQGRSEVAGGITHADELQLENVDSAALLMQLRADIGATHTFENASYDAVMEAGGGAVTTRLSLEPNQQTLTLLPFNFDGVVSTAALGLPEDSLRQLGWKANISLNVDTTTPTTLLRNTEHDWVVDLKDARFTLGNTGSQVRAESIDLDLLITPATPLQFASQLGARLNTRLRGVALPNTKLAMEQSGSMQSSRLNLTLHDVEESMSLSVKGTADLVGGAGNYALSLHSPDLPYASTSVLPLLDKFGLFQSDLTISSGRLKFDSDIALKSFALADVSQQSRVAFTNVSGKFDDYTFEGLNVTGGWRGIDRVRTVQPIAMTIAKVDVGFIIEQISIGVELPKLTPADQPHLQLNRFSANVFGGRVLLPEAMDWRVGAESNNLLLHAEDWQLAEMVKLNQGQNIQADGLLEGELPATVENGRILIENGYLRAKPPGGTIRYVPNESSRALAKSNKELELALSLLDDFQYEVLSTGVALDREGNLALGLALSGKNPKQYEGRAINFNINLEQNLDPLLQSLRLGDKLVEEIERRQR